MTRVSFYIDGFNLYYGLKAKGWRRYYWLDPYRLARNLLRPGQQLVAIKYFTARISSPPADPQKRRRQSVWLEAIAIQPLVQVFYGHYLSKPQHCRQCGANWSSQEEKMTDVNIAAEMIFDAFEDRFDLAILVSADSDLATPVRLILERFEQKRIIVVSPPERQSKKLESLATACFRIGRKILQDSQLPDEVTQPDGYVLRRPDRWR